LPDESIDLVDGNDRVVGKASIRECLERGLLHRAVAILVIRSSGRILLQQRNKNDKWQPGLWTLSSTGHVKAGESYDKAAVRELEEELGVVSRLSRLNKYLLPPISAGGLTEREWVTLYTGKSDSPVTIDPVELEGVEEVDVIRARGMIVGGVLTPDAAFLLNEYLRKAAPGP
jgi:16S rRNA (adenine1518-N6/adenine1519-N6)-dimethyltransferase